MIYKNQEDLFQNTTMTFGEHLEELRSALWKALVWLIIGFLIGLSIGKWVVALIKEPLEDALTTYYSLKAVEGYAEWTTIRTRDGRPLPYTPEEIARLVNEEGLIYDIAYIHPDVALHELERSSANPLGDAKLPRHAAAKADVEQALMPLFLWRPVAQDSRIRITSLNAQEAFSIFIKAALVVGLVISSPMVFYHLWSFVATGLYPHEKRYVHVFLPFSLGLFLLGAAVAFVFVFEPVLNFLFSFNRSLGIDPDPRISEWLSFVLILPLGFGVSFQLPLVMLFLERIGIFSVKAYLEKWRVSVMVIVLISSVLTPADPYSLLLMAIPLVGLYFGGIYLCKWLPKHRNPFDEA